MKRERDRMQDTLPPQVAAALSALRPAPEPDAEPWEARRRAFLTEARQFSTEAVSLTPIARRKTWKGLFSFQLKEGTMVALVKVAVAVALIFGMTAGTVSAPQESLPGSVLYPVKVQFENARLATTQDGAAKTLLALTYAQERVDEAVSLVERGDEIPEPLTVRYQLQVGLALQTMEGLGEAQQLQLRAHFSGTLQNQVRVMEQLMARLHQGENSEHSEPTQARIQTMLQTMQQTQQQLGGFGPHVGGNETPGNAEAPGPNPNDNGNDEDNGNGGDNDQCAGDCEGQNGETKDHDKHHQNGEDNGGGVSDNGQNNGDKGGGIDNGNGDDNGGNGAPNAGGNDNGGGSDTGGNGDGGNGGSGNGNSGGSGGGGGK